MSEYLTAVEVEGLEVVGEVELAVRGCSFHRAASTFSVPPSRSCRCVCVCVENDGGGLDRERVLED